MLAKQNFRNVLIKNQRRTDLERRVKIKSFGRLNKQKLVTIVITERLLSRKSYKKHPVRVILFFLCRELPIQDDWDAIELKDLVEWVAV